jgi:hypothetical protein
MGAPSALNRAWTVRAETSRRSAKKLSPYNRSRGHLQMVEAHTLFDAAQNYRSYAAS